MLHFSEIISPEVVF